MVFLVVVVVVPLLLVVVVVGRGYLSLIEHTLTSTNAFA